MRDLTDNNNCFLVLLRAERSNYLGLPSESRVKGELACSPSGPLSLDQTGLCSQSAVERSELLPTLQTAAVEECGERSLSETILSL